TEIADVSELVPRPLQQNEIRRRCGWIARIENEQRETPVNKARHKTPIVDIGVIVKIPPDLALTVHACPVDELQPYFIGQHVADGVEVARVEAVDVFGQQQTLRFGPRRN